MINSFNPASLRVMTRNVMANGFLKLDIDAYDFKIRMQILARTEILTLPMTDETLHVICCWAINTYMA